MLTAKAAMLLPLLRQAAGSWQQKYMCGCIMAAVVCSAVPATPAVPSNRAVSTSLFCQVLDESAIWSHIQTVEDTDALRRALPGLGLVGFVGDGSILPRLKYGVMLLDSVGIGSVTCAEECGSSSSHFSSILDDCSIMLHV